MDDQVTLPVYTDQVREMIRHDRNDEAIAICKHILNHYPKYIDAYRQMGEAYLEKGDLDSAKDLFRRVLSADPENVFAHTGLSIIFERQQIIDEAIWHLERAYELAPGNPDLQKELLRLYNEADVKAHTRLKLTPGALGRIYAQEGLYAHALQEFRGIIATLPSRYDIRVALAETLWRSGHLSEATAVAQSILEQLPYCIKANLILGAAWKQVGLPESAQYLHRAQVLDPTNQTAARLLGADSPLTTTQAFVPRYVEAAPAAPPTMTVMPGAREPEIDTASLAVTAEPPLDQTLAAEFAPALETESAADLLKPDVTPTTLPPWLQTPFPSATPVEAEPTPTQEIPSWLEELRQGAQPLAEENIPSIQAAPESEETTQPWLAEKPAELGEPSQDLPAWMAGPSAIAPEKPTESAPATWIPQEPVAAPTKPSEGTLPAWLADQPKAAEPTQPVEETLPPWMAGPSTTEQAKPAEETLPTWIAGPSTTEQAKSTEEASPPSIAGPSTTEQAKPAEEETPSWIKEKPTAPVEEQQPSLDLSTQVQEPAETVEPQTTQPLLAWLANIGKSAEPVAETPAKELVNQVIDDLKALIHRRLDVPLEAHRILGDAYARADRLSEALEEYRFVLEHTAKQEK